MNKMNEMMRTPSTKFGMGGRNHSIGKSTLTPMPNVILGYDIDSGGKITSGGIIILDDDGTDRGIHPRWCRIWKVGKNIKELSPGDRVLVEHGRWSRGVDLEDKHGKKITVRQLDPDAIMIIEK